MNDPDIGGVRQMRTAAHQIAEFAVGLKYEQIPPEVLERAKDCVIDTVKLTAHRDRARAERLFSQLAEAEKVEDFSKLDFAL